jgi:hypothetical protein
MQKPDPPANSAPSRWLTSGRDQMLR